MRGSGGLALHKHDVLGGDDLLTEAKSWVPTTGGRPVAERTRHSEHEMVNVSAWVRVWALWTATAADAAPVRRARQHGHRTRRSRGQWSTSPRTSPEPGRGCTHRRWVSPRTRRSPSWTRGPLRSRARGTLPPPGSSPAYPETASIVPRIPNAPGAIFENVGIINQLGTRATVRCRPCEH